MTHHSIRYVACTCVYSIAYINVLRMALQIAEAVCLMHGVRGGPFLHTDLKPDQFLLDDAGNVFLNDLNRGKFAPFRFELDDS